MPDLSPRRFDRPDLGPDALASGLTDTTHDVWTRRLVLFLRAMAVLSMGQGLHHWGLVTGFIGGGDEAFEVQTLAWQTATIYFAVIELVAAIGLWLATPWGAVIWLTTVVSTAVIELMFPAIYGGSLIVVGIEAVLLMLYLALAWMAAQERPP
jgi:fatty acid desaturase